MSTRTDLPPSSPERPGPGGRLILGVRRQPCTYSHLVVAAPPAEPGFELDLPLPTVDLAAAACAAQARRPAVHRGPEVGPPEQDDRAPEAVPAPRRPPEAAAAPAAAPVTDRDQRRDPELRLAFGELLVDLTGSEVLTRQAVVLLKGIVERSGHHDAQAPDADAVAATELLEELGRDLVAARTRLEDAERAHTEEQLERTLAEQARAEAERRLRDLQRRVQRSGVDLDVWWTPPEDRAEDLPTSMTELLARLRLPQLERVVFTGDPAPALELDEVVHTGLHLQRTWEALLALRDYAAGKAAGLVDSDVQGYLERTPDGSCSFPAGRHARCESATVESDPRLRTPRLLPVPEEVDPSGRVFMGAHLKLLTYGQTSPRLHYVDDTRRSGNVYVGYVGRHLPNTQTS